MKQLITRIDDDLHRKLKARAAEQDRSLNDLVSSVLAAAVESDDGTLRRRLRTSGLRVVPPTPASRRSRDSVIAALRGTGSAVSEALAAEREAT